MTMSPMRPVHITKEEFGSLQPSVRRMMVAQEVIDMLDRGSPRLKSSGVYCWIQPETAAETAAETGDIDRDVDLTEYLRTASDPWCDVCAIGALLIGHAVLFGEACPVKGMTVHNAPYGFRPPYASMDRERIARNLADYFSDQHLWVIEKVFEGRWNTVAWNRWTRRYPDRLECLRAICQNIVNNDGTFEPGQLPVQPDSQQPQPEPELSADAPAPAPECELVGA